MNYKPWASYSLKTEPLSYWSWFKIVFSLQPETGYLIPQLLAPEITEMVLQKRKKIYAKLYPKCQISEYIESKQILIYVPLIWNMNLVNEL